MQFITSEGATFVPPSNFLEASVRLSVITHRNNANRADQTICCMCRVEKKTDFVGQFPADRRFGSEVRLTFAASETAGPKQNGTGQAESSQPLTKDPH